MRPCRTGSRRVAIRPRRDRYSRGRWRCHPQRRHTACENVTTVSPEVLNPDGTRSEATADVEDLLYIVNFENEAGYAILGADDRLEPVYAVVDEGSLTTEEFRYAVTVTPEQAEADGDWYSPCKWLHRPRSLESKMPI